MEPHLWEPETPEPLYPAYSYSAYFREVTETGKIVADVDLGFGVILRRQEFELNGVRYTPSLAMSPSRRMLAQRIRDALLSSTGRLLILAHRRTDGYAVDAFYSDSGAPGAGPIYLNALVADGDSTVEE